MPESPDIIKKNLIRSTVWAGGAKVLSQGITFFTTIVLARLLVKEDFGLMAMVLTYTGFIDIFIDFGFLSAIIQIKEVKSKQLTSCFWFLLAGAMLAGAATIILAPFVAQIFVEPRLQNLLPVMALAVLCVPSQIICKGILSRNLQIDLIAKLELISGVIRAIISIFFAYAGAAVWSLVYGHLIEKLTLTITLPFYAKWYPRFHYDKQGVHQLLSFGLREIASSILWYIYNRADVFIIARLLGTSTLGIYTMASQFAMVIYQFMSSTWHRVAYPLFSKYQQSPNLTNVFLKMSIFLTFISLPLFLGITAMASDIVNTFLGAHWHAAIFPLQILSINAAIQTMSSLIPALFNAVNQPGINTRVNFYSVIVFSTAFYVGATLMGMNGVLWAWLIFGTLRYLILLIIADKRLNITVYQYIKVHARTIMAAVVMLIVVHLTYRVGIDLNLYVRMLLCFSMGVFSYLFLQFIISKELLMELLSPLRGSK